MSRFRILRRSERGAAAMEFALAVPVLIMLIWGIFQVGLLFWASAGMQHALGEGARFATLCINPSPTCANPTDAQIQARISSSVWGTNNGAFTVSPPTSGAGFKTLTVSYTAPTNFLFMSGPTVTLSQSKKVYIAV
ncbi:MAG TPA: TadE/TadG family type IV pilus assembly protein [Sphingomicrobium sp.]|nr:TadE/TadG family type IV pilus assembly protein [Sphingomicrobium sp.]